MRFMLLIYGDEEHWDDDQRKACMVESLEICHQLSEQEKLVTASPGFDGDKSASASRETACKRWAVRRDGRAA